MNAKEKIMISALAAAVTMTAAVSVFADGYNTQSDPLVTVSYVQQVKQEIKSEIGIDCINSRISELSSSIIALEQTQARQAQDIQQLKNSLPAEKKSNSGNLPKPVSSPAADEESGADQTGENTTDQEGEAKAPEQTEQTQTVTVTQTAAPAGYEVVHLLSGQTLTADSPLELIPRSGELAAVVTSETNRAAGVGLSDLTVAAEVLDGSILESNHYILVPRADGRGVTAVSDEAYLMVRGEYTIVG